MPSLVCIPITVHEEAAALRDADLAKAAGADLVEFRIDEFFSGSGDEREEKTILRLVAQSPLSCIITCRAASEGGHYDGDDTDRISLYERLGTASGKGEHPPRYIDCELATYTRSANLKQKVNLAVDHPAQLRDLRTSLILSLHDFNGRPADLTRRVMQANTEPAASIIKIAYRARSLRDNLELLELPSHLSKPTIAMGMGEFGLMSRVLAPKFGGFLTFASLRPTSTTAPGQPTVRELLDVYRFRSIRRTTSVYGVVGWPVAHSLSPRIHNAGFEAIEHDGVYLPLPIAASDDAEASYLSFKSTLLELIEHSHLGLKGCSVTIPHKENLVRLAREQQWDMDETSTSIGAANTLVVERAANGSLVSARILNTDADAAAACLEEALESLTNRRIAIIGAGGVARAVAFAAAKRGATVVVYNRTLPRAERLAADIAKITGSKVVAAALDSINKSCCDAFVNATSVGMTGGSAPLDSPIPISQMRECNPATVAFDTVYSPVETPFLRQAKAAGWRTIDGAGMFVRQAARQFESWTGKQAPAGLFERVTREALATRETQR